MKSQSRLWTHRRLNGNACRAFHHAGPTSGSRRQMTSLTVLMALSNSWKQFFQPWLA